MVSQDGGRVAALLRGAGDAADHPAEDDAVERGDRPPVGVPGQPVRGEGGPLPQHGRRSPVAVFHVELQPGQARAAASRRAAAAAGRARSPRPARSPGRRRRRARAGRAGPAAGRPRRPAGPASRAPPRPAGRSTSRCRRRSPRRPATAPAGSAVVVRVALVDVERCRRPSRDRWAAGRTGRRAPRPTTSGWRRRSRGRAATASRTASSKPSRPSGGSGTYSAMSCSRQTTVLRSDSTSGRAMPAGTGVIRPTQWLDSDGVKQRHGQDPAPGQAGHRGVPLHHLGVVHDVGPADVEGPVHRRPAACAQPTR